MYRHGALVAKPEAKENFPAAIGLPLLVLGVSVGTIVIAGVTGLVVAGIWWFLATVVLSQEHAAFLEAWRSSFRVLYVLFAAKWAWNGIIKAKVIPAWKVMKKHGCSFSQAYDFAARKYWDEMIRFALEKREGYEPWNTEQYDRWRKASQTTETGKMTFGLVPKD